jgi:hypothetical protein
MQFLLTNLRIRLKIVKNVHKPIEQSIFNKIATSQEAIDPFFVYGFPKASMWISGHATRVTSAESTFAPAI